VVRGQLFVEPEFLRCGEAHGVNIGAFGSLGAGFGRVCRVVCRADVHHVAGSGGGRVVEVGQLHHEHDAGAGAVSDVQVSGCTSLLEMNDESARNPSVMNSFFRGGDKTFRNFADSRGGHLACVEKVKGRRNREIIPVVRGDFFVSMIPSNVKLVFLSTDAQGFDLQVVSSFGTTLPDIDVIQVECQDLPEGHAMFLTRGAFSCADVQACMQVYSTDHVMVAAATGQPHNSCTINSPNNERNCLFRRMDRPYFTKTPNLLRRDAYDVAYPQRDNLQCPPLTQPAGVSTVPDDIDAD
jgi:hypothetical protein